MHGLTKIKINLIIKFQTSKLHKIEKLWEVQKMHLEVVWSTKNYPHHFLIKTLNPSSYMQFIYVSFVLDLTK